MDSHYFALLLGVGRSQSDRHAADKFEARVFVAGYVSVKCNDIRNVRSAVTFVRSA